MRTGLLAPGEEPCPGGCGAGPSLSGGGVRGSGPQEQVGGLGPGGDGVWFLIVTAVSSDRPRDGSGSEGGHVPRGAAGPCGCPFLCGRM